MLRTLSLALLSLTALASVGCKKEQHATLDDLHRYPMERAHVHYIYSGLGRGVEDLYFDHYGKREAKFANWQHLEDKGLRSTLTLTIANGPDIYMCLLDRGQGTHWKDPELDSLFHLDAANVPTPEMTTKGSLSTKGKIIRQDTVLGLTADVWQMDDAPVQLYIWRSVMLKRAVMAPGDTVVLTAASIDTTSQLSSKTFVVPSNVKMTERPAPPL